MLYCDANARDIMPTTDDNATLTQAQKSASFKFDDSGFASANRKQAWSPVEPPIVSNDESVGG